MIIDTDLKLWLVTEPSRPALGGAFYDKEAHALKVTNGKSLLIVPVRDDEDDENGVIIPADALKEAAKLGKGRTALPVEVKLKGGIATLRDGRSWPVLVGSFPMLEQVIPNKLGWTRTARIMLSAELLYELADAAGACGTNGAAHRHGVVTLEFNTHDDGDAQASPVLVTTGKATTAVIMPMRFKSQKDKKASDVPPDHAHKFERVIGRGDVCACGEVSK